MLGLATAPVFLAAMEPVFEPVPEKPVPARLAATKLPKKPDLAPTTAQAAPQFVLEAGLEPLLVPAPVPSGYRRPHPIHFAFPEFGLALPQPVLPRIRP